ncbi:DUF2306 domain-containing protein [Enteractinococcus helveticum]|uniref:DUF2306 domain-containing protein n=1 Tax=Enteractinococcus helveticum TaxID=1837282 RepID=A0A1B7LVN5_9MICC|nr:DUF2306 domain-containing protein [Enteractinococcus helveticum]OAV54211.1 hypothetical protein A6F49_00430 [Enteractinococcus helveticum]
MLHVVAGLTGVVCGATAALARKGGPVHVAFGRIYGWALVAIIATMAAMAVMRWQENWYLVPIGLVAGGALAIGWLDRRRQTPGHDRVHIVAMGCSYVALLTGFYVDNGPHLPLWRYLPDWAFWVIPSVVGLPIIIAALRRRPASHAVEPLLEPK